MMKNVITKEINVRMVKNGYKTKNFYFVKLSKYMAAILQLATNSITSTKSVNTISAATTNLYLFVECHVCAP